MIDAQRAVCEMNGNIPSVPEFPEFRLTRHDH